MKKIKKRLPLRANKRKLKEEFDEEISEDEAFDRDPGEHGSKKDEGGELWKYIQENYSEGEEDEESFEKPDHSLPNGKEDKEFKHKDEDKDLILDRLEENLELNGTILDFDQMEENDASYKWITQSKESKDAYKKLVKRFKQMEQDVPEILKAESRSRANKMERKTQYELVKKQVTKKWAPIVSQINKQETVVYGEEEGISDPTCSKLYASLNAETEFEKALENYEDDKIKKLQGEAYARAVLAREQKKNKRINRIKSKRWHKRQKQRDLQVAAKLLSKIEDPDLANEIKNTFERKRTEKRILRKKEAQSKWAKMALRYGGKNLLKEISTQNQNLQNDYQLIEQVTKGSQEEDATEESEEESEDDEEKLKEIHQDKLNVIFDSSVPIPEKGLFNLTFMKNAIERKRLEEEREEESEDNSDDDDHESDALYNDEEKEELDYNLIVNQEGVEVEEQIKSFNKIKEREKEEFTKEEMEKARKEVEKRLNNDQFKRFDKMEDKTTYKIKSIGYDTSIYKDKTNVVENDSDEFVIIKEDGLEMDEGIPKVEEEVGKTDEPVTDTSEGHLKLEETLVEREKENTDVNDSTINNKDVNDTNIIDTTIKNRTIKNKDVNNKDIKNKDSKSKKKKEKEKNKVLEEDVSMEEFIESLDVPELKEANREFVKQMFVTRPEEENYLEESEEEEDGEKQVSLKGWGSWTGYGIKEKEEFTKEEKERTKRTRVKVNKKKDAKLAKYYIHKLPHPFNNRHEYNSKMEIPIGPEWNTMNMHKKLIQPKTSVKIGAVVMPLGSGADKHKQLLRDYGKRMIKNRTHAKL